MNAHAWTEVYFAGFGWLTFDATPGSNSSDSQGGTQSVTPPAPTPTTTPEPTTEPQENQTPEPGTPEPSETPGGNREPDPEQRENPSDLPSDKPESPENNPDSLKKESEHPTLFPWWILILMLILLCGLRLAATSPSFLEKRAKTEEIKFDLWADEVKILLRAEQLERENGETLMDFARRVDQSALFTESVTPAAECLSVIRYSRRHPMESDTGLMRDTALLLHGEMTKKARFRYFLRRFFTGGKQRRAKAGKA